MAKARQQYFADEVTLQKENRDFAIQPELIEKLESIEAWAQVNVIETVKVNWEALTPDENKAVDVSVPLVEDTLYSTDPDKALSANQWKVLYEYIQNLASRGRYLSNWNAVTWLPTTNPVDNPYQYRAWDYYVVSNVAAEGGTNYRPNGSSYSRNVASTTVETEVVKVWDYYTYDWQHWLLLVNTAREIAIDSSLSTTSTNPVENRVITNALNTKQNNITDLETIRSWAALWATALQPWDSLSELTWTSDDITQWTTNLFMTTAERSKLSNQSWVNTWDETQTTIKNKLWQASTSTDGYLTSTDWNTFNNKQWAISDLETIRSNASAWKNASDTIATYWDVVTHDANEFATASQGWKADTALQPWDNVSTLTNDAWYVTDAYHDNTKQDKLIAWANIQIAADWKTISATDTTYVAWDFDIKDLADSTGLRTEWSWKQDELIAWTNIQIAADWKTISATDTTYTAWPGISISNNNVISNTQTSAEWWNIQGTLSNQTDLQSALDDKQDTLTAWANIQIAQDGTISATDTTYTAGTWIDITNWVISNTQTSAEWWNITWTLSNQTDLQSALDAKQDDLIAWANIQITGNTISATDTTYTASDFDIKDLADSTGKRASWDAKQNAISDLATIRSNASTAIQPNDNVSELTNDAGYITSADIPALDTAMSSTSTNGVQNKVIKDYVDTQVQEATSGAVSDTAYWASWDWITGIAPSKNAVYDKISAMDTTIAWKQNTISDLATIRTGAWKWATAVQPWDNISTLNNDSGFITKAVNDLTNYYTKNETYTKAEVADYVANFAWFKVVAQLPTTDIKTTIIYLLWPVGTWADKYEEYIYSNNAWVKIWETSVDLTNYFNTSTDNSDSITQGSTNLFLTSAERTKLSNTSGTNTWDETKATIQSKLGAATSSNDWYLTSADWTKFNNKQNALSTSNAWENIKISNWVISANNVFIITEDDVTVSTSEDYGVAPYSTSYKYTNIDISANAGIEWREWAIYTFVVDTEMVVASAYRNVRVRIWTWDYIPVMWTTAALGGNSYFIKTAIRQFQYTTKYEAGWALHVFTDSNTTYKAMTEAQATAWTSTSALTISPAILKWAIQTHAVNDTAYASSWNWVTNVAPSKNAVYDKISAMDTTISSKANASDVNTKTFTITWTSDYTNATSAVQWYLDGKTPIIAYKDAELYDAIPEYFYLRDASIVSEASLERYGLLFVSPTDKYDYPWQYRQLVIGATVRGGSIRDITGIAVTTENYYTAGTWISISNWVISSTVDWWNTKTFYLASTSDTTTAQAAFDWTKAWKNAIIISWWTDWYEEFIYSRDLNWKLTYCSNSINQYNSWWTSSNYVRTVNLWYSWTTVSWVSFDSELRGSYLATDIDYSWYTPLYDWSPATKKYVDDNAKTYNAWQWIEILNWNDYSAMQWPAPDWFHVPLNTEWQAVYDVWTALGGWSSDWTNFWIALKLPFAGFRSNSSAGVASQGKYGCYWSSSHYNATNAYDLSFTKATLYPQNYGYRTLGYSVRCFKNTPTIPTSSWTKLYWTSIEAGWIFWSSADWLISLSSDWQTWITIADKNLGATTVWNSGDTVSESNSGWYFQWGNNYMFPFTWSVTTSSTQVDASNYWPWNYYSSSTFITWSTNWSSVQNDDLWWWVTWVVTLENAITNTGVLSVNGQTGDVTTATVMTAAEYSQVSNPIAGKIYFIKES